MRYIYNGVGKDGNGKVIQSATVSVYLAGTTTPASVYAAESGGVAVNSVLTDSSDGSFSFWVDTVDYTSVSQTFKITISKTNFRPNTFDDLVIFNGDVKPSNPQWWGAVGDGVTDDTAAFNLMFASVTAIEIPDGTYNFTNLVVDDDEKITVVGGSRYGTILNCTASSGIGIRVVGTGRTVWEKFTIIGGDIPIGFKIDSDTATKYPFTFAMSDVEISGLTAAGSIALSIVDVSHLQVQNVNLGAVGTGMQVEAGGINTGVYSFVNCFFNSKDGDYGANVFGSVIDSMAFVGCYFGGSIASEKIGEGTNTVSGISHLSCHYENNTSDAGATLVYLGGGSGVGVRSSSWTNCTFGGFGVCENAFDFPTGVYEGIDIKACWFQNIKETGYVIADAANSTFKDCNISSIKTVTTSPNLFLTNNFRDSAAFTGGWLIQNDGYFDPQKTFMMSGIKTFPDESRASDVSVSLITDQFYKDGDNVVRVRGTTTAIIFADIDNTGTPSVLGMEKVETTGTTSITNFDDGVAGQIIYLMSSHSVTIVYGTGAEIILAGSADFDMIAGDTLTLINHGDKWKELSRCDR